MKRKPVFLFMRSAAAAVVLTVLGFSVSPAVKSQEAVNEHESAASFDKIARTVFKRIYPFLAKQIIQDYGITRGRCLDVGAGPGYLSIELAKISDLEIAALDIDPEAVAIAERNVREAGVGAKVKSVLGDVHRLPMADESIDLVVSRGSYLFWKDMTRAFREINRVLKPGGVAFVGGGLGSLLPAEERKEIQDTMEREKIGPPAELKVEIGKMGEIIRRAGITDFVLKSDEGCLCGLWVEFRKPKAESSPTQ